MFSYLYTEKPILYGQEGIHTAFFGGSGRAGFRQHKDKIKEFITNPNDDPNLPEREKKVIEGFGEYPVSKGIISLQNDRGTSY